MEKTVLVTGAAGFIGSNLCDGLLDLGCDVVGLDCMLNQYSPAIKRRNANRLLSRGMNFIETDLANGNLAELDSYNLSSVFHIAAWPGLDKSATSENYVRNNFLATFMLTEYLKAHHSVDLFVNACTSSVYGFEASGDETTPVNPVSSYGSTKALAEDNVFTQFATEATIATSLRLYSVYGPYERPDKLIPRLFYCAMTGQKFTLFEGSLEHDRSFTYVTDVVDCFLGCMSNRPVLNNEIFNIGNPNYHRVKDIIETVESITKKTISFKVLPPREGDQTSTHANIEKARKLLNFSPKTEISEGVAKAWEIFKVNFDDLVDEYKASQA